MPLWLSIPALIFLEHYLLWAATLVAAGLLLARLAAGSRRPG